MTAPVEELLDLDLDQPVACQTRRRCASPALWRVTLLSTVKGRVLKSGVYCTAHKDSLVAFLRTPTTDIPDGIPLKNIKVDRL